MRTSTLLAKTHKGNWELLAHPGIPLVDQKKKFREFLGTGCSDKYCYIQMQESDGHLLSKHLRSLDAQKKHDAARKAEQDAAEQAGKDEEAGRKNQRAKVDKERADQLKEEIDRLNSLQNPKPKKETEEAQAEVSTAPPVDEDGLRTDGPTLAEWESQGYKKENYPPQGFAAKPSAAKLICRKQSKKTKNEYV